MKTTLELIDSIAPDRCYALRLTFHSAATRLLLPYPKVTHICFDDASSDTNATWYTHRILSGVPLDTFVVAPGDAISFVLHACFVDCTDDVSVGRFSRWHVELNAGRYNVQYACAVETDWNAHLIDRLQKDAEIDRATLHLERVESNTIAVTHPLT